MSVRVVVTGLGAITPLGNDVPSTWQAMIEGRSGIAPITAFDASDLQTHFAGEVKGFDPQNYFGRKEARRMDRYTQLAVVAAKEAMGDAGLLDGGLKPERGGAIVGSGIGGIGTLLEEHEAFVKKGPEARKVSPLMAPMMLVDSAAGQVSISFNLRGPNAAVVAACATGNYCLGEAAAMIKRGAADVILVGGSEAPIYRLVVVAFNSMGAISTRNEEPQKASRPFDATRDGFVLSEGAAMMTLENLEHARARGARIYAELVGYGASADAHHITAPPEDGRGAIQAMQAALQDAGISAGEVDYINAHGTSTPLNDATETKAIKSVLGEHAYRVAISSTKSMAGHLQGAAGSIEALACVKTIADGVIHPTINYATPDPECDLDYVPNQARKADVRVALSNSFGFGGHNACILFRKFEG